MSKAPTHWALTKHTTACDKWYSQGVPRKVTNTPAAVTCKKCKKDLSEIIAGKLT